MFSYIALCAGMIARAYVLFTNQQEMLNCVNRYWNTALSKSSDK